MLRNPLELSAAHAVVNAMLEVNRPGLDAYWQRFRKKNHIVWKTGTSFGFRDAWALGFNQTHLVVAWVGNADNSGVHFQNSISPKRGQPTAKVSRKSR